MIKLYYHPSPNPAKVALFLEEAELPYEVVSADTRRGEQHAPAFLAINPNAKTPALTDGEATLFDSTAILLYLARKTGRFLAANTPAQEARSLSWLLFVATGIGPYSGQAAHFTHFAPEPREYPLQRYRFEMERHWSLLDAELAKDRYMVGDSYSIVDMSIWGWARAVPFILGQDAWAGFPNVKRLIDEIDARPAAARAKALATAHPYKTEVDEEARGHLFPSVRQAVAS